MRDDYMDWLKRQEYAENTCVAQVHRVKKVEEAYGDLEKKFAGDKFSSVINELNYSTSDERANKPNPSRLNFDGNIRNNLQSYKNAVVRYRKFLEGRSGGEDRSGSIGSVEVPSLVADLSPTLQETVVQKLSLERDMQASLRRDISSLESGLRIIDDGAERSVETGFIDILCRDRDNRLVVVELKAATADNRAIGQILGYMGDLAEEEDVDSLRGILVAHAFDRRTRSAARVIPNLILVKYSVRFSFEVEE